MTNDSPTILAIETATSSCSVALSYGENNFTRDEVGNNIHSKVVLEMVQSVLDQAKINKRQLHAVAVGQGPGSFTGLRIGVGVAQGIAYGVDVPMIGISSLDALANQATKENVRVIAGIDARMGEIYWCEYIKTINAVQRIGSLMVSPPDQIVSRDSDSHVELLGNAWQEYQGKFSQTLLHNSTVIESEVYPMAESLLELAKRAFASGELINATDFAPEYVRNDVAKKSTKTLKGKR